jgi:signal transduction histidine kinase
VPIVLIDASADELRHAGFVVTQSRAELGALLRESNGWFLGALLLTVAGVVGLSFWLSHKLSRPLADLATAASRIDLDGEAVSVAAAREDEIGTLAKRLGGLAARLGASAERLRNAERRATVGDMARQVNHDIKNGLIPIRNVLRHLAEVTQREPLALPTAFSERRGTLDASVAYLDTLARQYARLTPRLDRVAVDVNAVAREAAVNASIGNEGRVRTRLTPSLPPVTGDPVVLRRILDNLVRNGLESLDGNGGDVTIATARNGTGAIFVTVTDTGRGMTPDEAGRAFEDFFTTRETGTGLGLSVVRRLTSDLGGTVRMESSPGRGTTFTLELPA